MGGFSWSNSFSNSFSFSFKGPKGMKKMNKRMKKMHKHGYGPGYAHAPRNVIVQQQPYVAHCPVVYQQPSVVYQQTTPMPMPTGTVNSYNDGVGWKSLEETQSGTIIYQQPQPVMYQQQPYYQGDGYRRKPKPSSGCCVSLISN